MSEKKYTQFRIFILLSAIVFLANAPAHAEDTGKKGKVNPIPRGYHTVTPYLWVKRADKALEFYKQAFGAEVIDQHSTPDGKRVLHAEIKIGDSVVMISDDLSEYAPPDRKRDMTTKCALFLYVPDVDKSFRRALDAGCKVQAPLRNQFWGDRYGEVIDPFGQQWSLATHVEDVPLDEVNKRAKDWFKEMSNATDDAVRQSEAISPKK